MGCECLTAPPADEYGRLTPETLAVALDGRDPDEVVAVATAGATNNGAVDDLAGLAALCSERGIWLHVDGAYGGGALLGSRARQLFAGIERADSFIVDPHKWLYAPFDCAAVLYRDAAAARRALTQEAEYLEWLSEGGGDNPSDLAIHLTRRIRACPSGSHCKPTAGTPMHRPSTTALRSSLRRRAGRQASLPGTGPGARPSAHRPARAPPRLAVGRLRCLVGAGSGARPRLCHPHQARRRDRAAPVLRQSTDEPRRRRSRARRSGRLRRVSGYGHTSRPGICSVSARCRHLVAEPPGPPGRRAVRRAIRHSSWSRAALRLSGAPPVEVTPAWWDRVSVHVRAASPPSVA